MTHATGEPAAPTEAELLGRARTLAAGYDYDAAAKALAGLTGEEAEAARTGIAKAGAMEWKDNSKISHLFFHPLIVDPKRAFDGDSRQRGYPDYMVTMKEFGKINDELHNRGFVLVNPSDIAGLDKNGKMAYRRSSCPRARRRSSCPRTT
ncbi:hypothetical protein [Paeniglutamicibacter kerguelensis]|uniref:Uncharacterized protein n=1 Tax=Paeniglutamicibacter kerguelensis TaxID=254788 RepID=A0ABS4X8C9_9MICC|nr:hypothetical protein [Paeniglutamicibacter kerguelensis]MBP2384722.1 hypothetical protein [Paeniglutamicibacter kerguelensis]